MKFKSIFFLALGLAMLFSCKSSDQSTSQASVEPTNLIVLLQEGISPESIDLLRSINKDDMKRISRSQNQWMIKLSDQKIASDLKTKLEQDERVIEISMGDKNESETTKSAKSGKSSPIKDN